MLAPCVGYTELMRGRVWAVVLGLAGGSAACTLAFDTDVLVSDRGAEAAGGGESDGSAPVVDARAGDGVSSVDDASIDDAGADAPIELIVDAATEPPLFLDEFARPDAPEVGNGWTEKNPVVFSLSNNGALKQSSGTFYRDNLVYRRELGELDVEVVAEFDVTTWPCGSPQVHARIQPGTAASLNTLDSYVLFVGDAKSDAVTLARQHGSAYSVKLADLPIPEQKAGGQYRLVLRVKGTQTVAVAAAIEKKVAGVWERLQIGAANDLSSNSAGIRMPGHVGFSGDKSSSGRFRYTRFQVSRIK
ncbi:MAG: hypothetical protein BGO98_39610 [Myxococcales bacterium 68-20]|nr:MAG: hypothetical protein BGO98_39610 [Myxococcales bacterium 68-20]